MSFDVARAPSLPPGGKGDNDAPGIDDVPAMLSSPGRDRCAVDLADELLSRATPADLLRLWTAVVRAGRA